MKLRIYETNGLDLDTVVYMLYQADKQANFHPDSLWILSASDGEINNYNQDETGLSKRYMELRVKWIGREAVVNWLVSNQVVFEIISHEFLEEELEAIGELKQENERLIQQKTHTDKEEEVLNQEIDHIELTIKTQTEEEEGKTECQVGN